MLNKVPKHELFTNLIGKNGCDIEKKNWDASDVTYEVCQRVKDPLMYHFLAWYEIPRRLQNVATYFKFSLHTQILDQLSINQFVPLPGLRGNDIDEAVMMRVLN